MIQLHTADIIKKTIIKGEEYICTSITNWVKPYRKCHSYRNKTIGFKKCMEQLFFTVLELQINCKLIFRFWWEFFRYKKKRNLQESYYIYNITYSFYSHQVAKRFSCIYRKMANVGLCCMFILLRVYISIK